MTHKQLTERVTSVTLVVARPEVKQACGKCFNNCRTEVGEWKDSLG